MKLNEMIKERNIRSFFLWFFIVGTVFVFFVYPFIRMISLSFIGEHGITLEHLKFILKDSNVESIVNTLIIGCLATLLNTALGLLFAFIISYTDVRFKKLMQIFIILPLLVPSYMMSISWTEFVRSIPLIDIDLYSLGGIVFVLGINHYALVYLMSVQVFTRIPKSLEQAIQVNGGNRLDVLKQVTIPMGMTGIIGGMMIAALSNIDNFGVPAFLGIPGGVDVLSTSIYQAVISYGDDAFLQGSILSLALVCITFCILLIQWILLRQFKPNPYSSTDRSPRIHLGKFRLFIEVLIWLFFIITSIMPLVALVKTSLTKTYGAKLTMDTLTLKNFQYILFEYDKSVSAIQHSAMLAISATIISFIIAIILGYMIVRYNKWYMRFTEIGIAIPYSLPGTVLSLSLIIFWIEPIPGVKPGIYGTVFILLIAYILRFTILPLRSAISTYSQIHISLEHAASVSGNNILLRFKNILLPLLTSGMIGGLLLMMFTALTELTLSALLWASGSETIGVVIFSFESAGYKQYSSAFSVIVIILLCLGGLLYLLLQSMFKRKDLSQ